MKPIHPGKALLPLQAVHQLYAFFPFYWPHGGMQPAPDSRGEDIGAVNPMVNIRISGQVARLGLQIHYWNCQQKKKKPVALHRLQYAMDAGNSIGKSVLQPAQCVRQFS